jgi:predicted membrane-bound mannosyltransferase
VEKIAAAAPEKNDLLIKVIAPSDETWPLPWYLRQYGRVGYWTSAEIAGDPGDAAVVIVSAADTAKVEAALGDAYSSAYFGLRPEVVLSLFARRDLWDRSLGTGPRK